MQSYLYIIIYVSQCVSYRNIIYLAKNNVGKQNNSNITETFILNEKNKDELFAVFLSAL